MAKAHLDATAAVMAVFLCFSGRAKRSEASWVDLKIGPRIVVNSG